MKISWNWLCDYIKSDLSIDEVSAILTSIGLEVESVEKVETVKGGLEGFVVGKVLECEKHPNADKLRVTKVDLGDAFGVKNIVCGAPNVAAGQTVVVATEGTTIYLSNGESFVIKASKIRGEASEGMICAEDEMGIGESHDGIMVLSDDVKRGTLAKDYFNISSDIVFEIGLTPNRTDAMSHQGVARDLAAALSIRNIDFQYSPEGKQFEAASTSSDVKMLKIENKTKDASIFYGVVMSDVHITESPEWLKNRLISIGEKPKNNIVDITNYVLHDTGHPIHAYDYDKVKDGALIVKNLESNVSFEALTGSKFELKENDVVISDASSVLCLGGIVGGKNSEITSETKNVLIECAYFNATAIRKTSQRIEFKSEAAMKYEKGVDPNQTLDVITKSMNAIATISGAKKASDIIKTELETYDYWNVTMSKTKLDMYAGRKLEDPYVSKILEGLGIKILQFQEATWTLSVPRYKEDVTRDVDVIEEILRISGYDNVPYPSFLKSNLTYTGQLTMNEFENKISNLLVGKGFSEIMTNSISQSKYYSHPDRITLLNSMTAELDCLRTSLIPGFLEVIQHNVNRGNKDVAFFEIGSEYFKKETYSQSKKLTIALSGLVETQNWQHTKGVESSYFKLKGVVESLLARYTQNVTYVSSKNEEYSYIASLQVHNKNIGTIGELSKKVLKSFDIKQDVFVVELDMNVLYELQLQSKMRFKEISKFPSVKRDLALVIDEAVSYSQIEMICKKQLKESLSQIQLFDIFKDAKLGENKKSYAIRLTIQNKEKTMSDVEIDELIQGVLKKLNQELKAELRA